ncbi:MAG: hypothetical protein RR091_11085 [Cloacibacillus sp.]
MAKNTLEDVFKNQDIRKIKQHHTPVGTAALIYLNKPSTEYNEDGVFCIKLKLPAAAKALIKTIDAEIETAEEAVLDACETEKQRKAVTRAKPSYTFEEDDEGNETGYVLFNFKRNATRKDRDGVKKPVNIPTFDATLRPIDLEEVEIWSGSEVAIAFKLVPYYKSIGVGVSHRLEAVQVVKAVSGGAGRTAEQFGFAAVDNFPDEEETTEQEDKKHVPAEKLDTEENGDY